MDAEKIVDWINAMTIVSEANRTGEHWTSKRKRHKIQQWQIKALFQEFDHPIPLPCKIVMTRLYPRLLDYVNLTSSFKWIQDQIADCILPGLAKGRADGDLRLSWEFMQEKSSVKGMRLEIYTNMAFKDE